MKERTRNHAAKGARIFTSKMDARGRSTISRQVREAMKIKPGDTLNFELDNDGAAVRVRQSILSLKGVLASNKGKGISFNRMRRIAQARAKQLRHDDL